MKQKLLLYSLVMSCILAFSCSSTVHVSAPAPRPVLPPPPAEISYQTFYDELGPYGHWIDYPSYGYVWLPAAEPGFRPYATGGHWVYSDAGWTWVSEYPWGWATFHYGRWFFEEGYGWIWVPGREWAPAWVSWRRGADVYGWAPLTPGISVNFSFNSYDPPAHYWCFVPHQYVTNPHVNNYYVEQNRNVTIIKNTTIINNNTTVVNNYGSGNSTNINSNNDNNNGNNRNNSNTINSNNRQLVYKAGPDKAEVEQVTNSRIQQVALHEGNKPGEQAGNGQLVVYRPKIAAMNTNAQNKPAPTKIESLKGIKPNAQAIIAKPDAAEMNPSINTNNSPKEMPPVPKHVDNPPAAVNTNNGLGNKISNLPMDGKKNNPEQANNNKPVTVAPIVSKTAAPDFSNNKIPGNPNRFQRNTTPVINGKPGDKGNNPKNKMNQQKQFVPATKKPPVQKPVKNKDDKKDNHEGGDRRKE